MKILVLMLACMPLGCGGAPTLMQYHRQTLDELAEGTLECPVAELTIREDSPENLPHVGGDPETRRYLVTGCDREGAFLCFTDRRLDGQIDIAECRPLRRNREGRLGGLYVGPLRVN